MITCCFVFFGCSRKDAAVEDCKTLARAHQRGIGLDKTAPDLATARADLLGLVKCWDVEGVQVVHETVSLMSKLCPPEVNARKLVETYSVDELFPKAQRDKAVGAGCGELELRDGTKIVHPGIATMVAESAKLEKADADTESDPEPSER